MRGTIPIFEPQFLSSLLDEFRRTMRGLLFDLCEDLQTNYSHALAAMNLPVAYFRLLGRSLRVEDYSNWKVVGWIEELNDLVYFIDLQRQLRRESGGRPTRGFAEALLAECKSQFYEHHYFDELFPNGQLEQERLGKRLSSLCARLAKRVIQESLFMVPGLPCQWLVQTRKRSWTVPCDLRPNFEQAERGGCVYLGLDGARLEPFSLVRRTLARGACRATFVFRSGHSSVSIGGEEYRLPARLDTSGYGWRYVPPYWIRKPGASGYGGLTLGDTLAYGKNREPARVVATPPSFAAHLQQAVGILQKAWPLGASHCAALTSRVVPLRAAGVVSFSYRHRPGLSFINMFERDQLDLIDDLIHENSHHYLNLLLRKYRMLREGCHEEMFYSPWRRSLRPLRGILHATFTFTMGVLLFERLSSWRTAKASGRGRREPRGEASNLRSGTLRRARFRGLEELASVRYSIPDLYYAATQLKWLTPSGLEIVRVLERQIDGASRSLEPFRDEVMRSRYGFELRRHCGELETARKTYGLFCR